MWWRRKKPMHALDYPLLYWTPNDPFRVRDLLNGGLLILGRAGSGKTSSSGARTGEAIVSHPGSGGLILAAKPEDAEDWRKIFERAGRLQDLIVFDAQGDYRFNFLDYVGNGQIRNVVQCLMMIGETLKRGEGKGGKDDAAFWEAQNERLLYNAVAALQAAKVPISAERIHAFIMTAASEPKELASQDWQAKYHNQVLAKGDAAPKTPLEAHDFKLAYDFWTLEYPAMDTKTRSNVLAGVMGILHVYNTGIVREMVSGGTNVSPDDILAGKWVLVNFPPSTWGEVGSFICSGWKFLTELAILKRKAEKDSPFATIWCDEAHQFVNSFDSAFIAQCRSHMGCLVYLSQSVSSFYAAMKGHAGEHQTTALLANFAHWIVHACDPTTAKVCASMLGREKQMIFSGSMNGGRGEENTIYDELMGRHQAFHGSFSEHYEQVLQDQVFMVGRTGGPVNDFLADAVVLKSGEPFAWGGNYLITAFSQKG